MKPFRISDTRELGATRLLHGQWHPDHAFKLRYLCLKSRGDGCGNLGGFVTPEEFRAVMQTLVSADYDTPNWCEKCHLAGHDGCCRCEIACNE